MKLITGYDLLTKRWPPEREWVTFKKGKSHLYREFWINDGTIEQITACGINLENHFDAWFIEDWRSNSVCQRCKQTAYGKEGWHNDMD